MSAGTTVTRKADVAIIGTGTAGMGAYRNVQQQTDSVLILEADHYGTTCARVGCMPSKLLIAAAEHGDAAQRASEFGITISNVDVDGYEVMARVRSERDRFVQHTFDAVSSWPEEHKLQASARFIDNNTLSLSDGSRLEANTIIVCTGSAARMPEEFSQLGPRVITSDAVFEWQTLPQSVAVFGGGVIGLELGQALERLGVRTRVFGKGGSVAQLQDPAVLSAARHLFSERYSFLPDATVTHKSGGAEGVEITYQTSANVSTTEQFDWLLVAVGRTPNLADLQLENTTLKLDERGQPAELDANGRGANTSIYFAGDVANGPPLLHLASLGGKAAGAQAVSCQQSRWQRPTQLSITFTNPQIMTVGKSWSELQDQSPSVIAGAIDWSDQGRARVLDMNAGLLRLYADPEKGKLLGAEMVGPRAEHLAHLLAWSIESELTADECLARPFYHPCLEEGVRSALRQLADQVHPATTISTAHSIDCGPGS